MASSVRERKINRLIAAAILLGVILAGVQGYRARQAALQQPQHARCADLRQGCRITLPGGQLLEVRFSGAPGGLRPFGLAVKAPGMKEVHAWFDMPEMVMEPNRYRLLPAGGNVWQAQVTLPVCASGRRTVVVILELDGSIVHIPFVSAE